MKARPEKLLPNGEFKPCDPKEATHLRMEFPITGDLGVYLRGRCIPVMLKGDRKGTGKWSWNGDVDKPTLKPSILTRLEIKGQQVRCHSWVTDGQVQFLGDCTHELKGQTFPLLNIYDDDL